MFTSSKLFAPLFLLTACILMWEVIVRLLAVPEYLVPSPSRILTHMSNNASHLTRDFGVTAAEAFVGFILANMCSLLFGILFYYSKTLERAFLPLLVTVKSVPVVAISPLVVLWLGYGFSSKAAMAALVAFFPLVVGTVAGIRSTPREALDLMRTLGATRTEILVKVSLLFAIPHMMSALKVSAALAVVGAVVAEMTGATKGLGFTVLMSSYNVDTPMLFAAIVLSGCCGILLYGVALVTEFCLKRCGLTGS